MEKLGRPAGRKYNHKINVIVSDEQKQFLSIQAKNCSEASIIRQAIDFFMKKFTE